MRVLFLSNLYPPFVRGGAEYLGAEFVKELSNQGHEVAVFTSVPWSALNSFRLDKRQEATITVYRFWPLNLYHYLYAEKHSWPIRLIWQLVNLFNVYSAHRLRQVMREFKPELVVSFNLMGLGFNLPPSIKSFGIHHIHVLHDIQLLYPTGLMMFGKEKAVSSVFAKAYQLINKFLWRNVPEVLSPSKWLLELHQNKGLFKLSQTQVLPNPVLSAINEIKKSFGPRLTISYVGQIEEHKGIFWLIDNVKKLPAELQAMFILEIIPTGQSAGLLEMIKENKDCAFIKIRPNLIQLDIDKAVARSNLVIVPSLCYENSPVTISKAQLVGTPVLASNIGGIPEMIKPEVTGWLFEPGNSDEFIGILSNLLKNPDKLAKVSELAKSGVSANILSKYTRDIVNLHTLKREQKQLLK